MLGQLSHGVIMNQKIFLFMGWKGRSGYAWSKHD